MMQLNHDMCYQAVKAQDARFDGLFYTAVKTTGIYCRPICRVRPPKSENCTFYETAAQAEANGYRPCLRCRPELAPGYADYEQASELVQLAIACFEEQHYLPKSVQTAAEQLGISTRHLSRVFQQTLGVSPQSYLMTKRLLAAKQLLTDTQLPITEIALLVGFGSVSRFNAAFKKHYRLTPSSFRTGDLTVNARKKPEKQLDAITLMLAYRPPYDWDKMMQFFRMRAIEGVEWVTDDNIYRRTVRMAQGTQFYTGWVAVEPLQDKSLVQVTVSRSLEKVLLPLIQRIRSVFDLDAAPHLMPEILTPGIRLPGCFDAFEMSTRAILGQQITVKAAKTLARRMTETLGTPLETPWPEVRVLFPSAEEIVHLDAPITDILGNLGVINSRSRSIEALAIAIADKSLKLQPGMPPEDVRQVLLSLPGIGPWTAEYLTMRVLSWPDAFPVADIGVRNALLPDLFDENELTDWQQSSKHQQQKKYEAAAMIYAEAYRPWRSYLTLSLWHSLSDKD